MGMPVCSKSKPTVEQQNKHCGKAGRNLEHEPRGATADADGAAAPDTPILNSESFQETWSREEWKAEVNRLREMVGELSYMFYGLSHDLREPIRTITSFSTLLKTQVAKSADPVSKEYIHFIASAAERVSLLASGILDYARLLEADMEPHGLVDMNAVLQVALANLQMPIEEEHAAIAHDELPNISGDFGQLVQLLQNLISNAIKYHGTAPPQIFVKAERNDSSWLFSIEDNGIGFDPQHCKRLFVPFKRLHGQEIPGVGLGLAICRSIVERHGGRIWAESRPGEGAVFRFTLPIREYRA